MICFKVQINVLICLHILCGLNLKVKIVGRTIQWLNAQAVLKQGNNIVKCGICLLAFSKPILLSCFHIFCTPCVTKLVEGRHALICPLCKAVHVLPDNDVDGITLYPYFQEEVPYDANLIIQCQMCGNGKDAVSKFFDCDSNMCLECSTYHLTKMS